MLLLSLAAAFRDAAAPASEPRAWVEKTPLNERHVQRFAALPGARFIQLVRKPNATLASLLEAYRTAGIRDTDVVTHARSVRHSLELAHRQSRQLAGRYLVVRYEDLTADPAREMGRVRAFIRIAPPPWLAVPTVCGQEVPSNSSFERSAQGVVLRQSRATVLSTADAKLVRAITAPAARHCGYSVTPLSALARFAIALRLLPQRAVAAVASRMRRRPSPRR